mmetsp:Transcript_6730/g.11587  ORF Transcript_6730/g.11587 Transcript_6730/m.11587 type:complete len:225 (+) Transcript_6730:128-802(+)
MCTRHVNHGRTTPEQRRTVAMIYVSYPATSPRVHSYSMWIHPNSRWIHPYSPVDPPLLLVDKPLHHVDLPLLHVDPPLLHVDLVQLGQLHMGVGPCPLLVLFQYLRFGAKRDLGAHRRELVIQQRAHRDLKVVEDGVVEVIHPVHLTVPLVKALAGCRACLLLPYGGGGDNCYSCYIFSLANIVTALANIDSALANSVTDLTNSVTALANLVTDLALAAVPLQP